MPESVGRTRMERVVPALGFALVVLLVVTPDYWIYDVLSSHDLVAAVSILIVSYVAFSVVLWLVCIAARGLGLHRLGKPDTGQRSGSAPDASVDVPGRIVDHCCQRRRDLRARRRGCTGREPRRRQKSA